MLFNDKTDTIFRRMMFGKSLSFLLFLGVITFCQTRVEMSPVKSPMLTTMTTETVAIPTTTKSEKPGEKSPDLMGTITDIRKLTKSFSILLLILSLILSLLILSLCYRHGNI
ncbi:unnamed protein product [Trichobilharzia szidati]|nr:unnamed protein product [Trichobilharzia szidati]